MKTFLQKFGPFALGLTAVFGFVRCSGPSESSADVDFHPGFVLPPAPDPVSVAATAAGPDRIDLSWASGGNGVVAYQIAYANGGTAPADCLSGSVIAFDVVGDVTSYQVTGLNDHSTYSFRICAVNGAYVPELSSGITGTTMTLTTTPLVSAVGTSLNNIDVSWTVAPGAALYRLDVEVGAGFVTLGTFGPGVTTFADGGLAPGTHRNYHLTTENAIGGAVEATGTAKSWEIPPPDPINFLAQTTGTTQIILSWLGNGGSTFHYQVSYQAGGTAPADCNSGTTIAAATIGTSSSIPVGGLASGTEYSFRVCALNDNPVPDMSAGTAFSNQWTKPTFPAAIHAVAIGGYGIAVDWTDVTGEIGYTLQRSDDGVTGWTTVATPAQDQTTYNDLGLAPGSAYYYRVQAYNNGGTSALSNYASATTAVLSSPIVSAVAVAAADDGAVGTTAWLNASNALTADAATARNNLGAGGSSHGLKLTGFFSSAAYALPGGAVIDGVVANCRWRQNGADIRDASVTLLVGGASVGNDNSVGALLPGSLTTSADFGSAVDLWGLALTPADVNAANFGLFLQLENLLGATAQSAFVDNCLMSVYWH